METLLSNNFNISLKNPKRKTLWIIIIIIIVGKNPNVVIIQLGSS